MALAVAWALHGVDRYSPAVLEPRSRERFVAWAHSPDDNRAPGMTCLRACGGLAEGLPWLEATMTGSKGCGANMRVTPVGLVPGLDLGLLAAVSQLQAAMTDGHPTALAAAELTAYATRLLVDGLDLADVPAALATGLYCAGRHAGDPVACLVRAARTSGDSDSVAALAGAFTGAAHGMAAWPVEWAERIEYADQLAVLTSL